MKHAILPLMILAALSASTDRGCLDFSFGGGAWIPAVLESGSELQAGPAVQVSLEIPMEMGHVVFLRSGYRMAGSNRPGWNGVSAIPLVIGYRTYPFYKPYAGSRGLEPILGVYGGGILAWDSADDDSLETSTTGGGVIGAEIGARIRISDAASIDVLVCPEWVPIGGRPAGEPEKDLSGLVVFAGLVF